MGLVEIVVMVCAMAHPAHCEDKRLQFAWNGSLDQCMMAAQPYIAQWIGDHPAWTARRWRCEYPGKSRQDT